MFGTRVDVQQGVEQGTDGQHQEQNGEGQRDVAEEMLAGGIELRHQFQAELHHQRGRHLRQAVENLVLQQIIDPVQCRLSAQQLDGVKYQKACHPAQHQGDDQQHTQAEARVYHGMLIKSAPKIEGVLPELFNSHAVVDVSEVKMKGY
ncbi:hypothetical protein D9M73_178620 [compost metagenome]